MQKLERKHKKQETMSPLERFVFVSLVTIGAVLTVAFGIWWFEPNHIPHNFSGYWHGLDLVAFLLLSYVVWYQIGYEVFSWYLAGHMKSPATIPTPAKGLRVALLTAFVPGSEPYLVLENSLKAMVAVEYPHDTWVLDEGDDQVTKKLCKRYGAFHYSRKGVEKYHTQDGKFKTKTKAGNYNSWFDQYADQYDIVAQHDVDFVPRHNFLMRTLGYFNDPSVAFVGTPQIYGNKDESWIARGAAEQAYGFYGHIQRGLYGHDMQLFIGANHIVRVAAHADIEGYSGHIVEDHLTGMKFYSRRWKSVYVPEVLAVGEGPATWDSYFSQQMRWSYGLIDILLSHSPSLFKRMQLKHSINYFLLQQYYFYGLAQFIGIFLISLYFLFGFHATSMSLLPLVILYLPMLLWQLVMFFWLQRFNVDPQDEKGFLWRGRLLNIAAWPIYLLAFFSVLMGKRLTYAVTPKGSGQTYEVNPSLFFPHLILGSVTAVGLVIAFFTHHTALQIVFWGVVNTLIMGTFFFAPVVKNAYRVIANRLPRFSFSQK